MAKTYTKAIIIFDALTFIELFAFVVTAVVVVVVATRLQFSVAQHVILSPAGAELMAVVHKYPYAHDNAYVVVTPTVVALVFNYKIKLLIFEVKLFN